MKNLVLLALAVFCTPAMADSVCQTKQKNAASYKLAQEIGVPVQNAEVIGFEYGAWTEALGNNTGSDTVTVRIGNRTNRGMTIKSYRVFGRQISDSDDCNVTSVEEVEIESEPTVVNFDYRVNEIRARRAACGPAATCLAYDAKVTIFNLPCYVKIALGAKSLTVNGDSAIARVDAYFPPLEAFRCQAFSDEEITIELGDDASDISADKLTLQFESVIRD